MRVLFCFALFFAFPCHGPASDQEDAIRGGGAFGSLSLDFIENRGQVHKDVAYYLKGSDRTVYFTSGGVIFALEKAGSGPFEKEDGEGARGWAVTFDFVDANPCAIPRGEDFRETVVSTFHGSEEEWVTGSATCSRLVYGNLWPGIDLVYSASGNRLKYECIVKPGADPSMIRFACSGATDLSVDEAGALIATTPLGAIEDGAPVAFQESEGGRKNIDLRYTIDGPESDGPGGDGPESDGPFTVGFEIGAYDRAKTLVIDPFMLVYSGFIGSPLEDQGRGIALDKYGFAYVTGHTLSAKSGFPDGPGGFDLAGKGSYDVFVAKVSLAGTRLVYFGIFGGDGEDYGYSIAVDDDRYAYVTGRTTSDETTFPVKVGPDLYHNGGLRDAYVAKINPTGTGIVYCGYIGGNDKEEAHGIALDSDGNAYVTGFTWSRELTFPLRVGPNLSFSGGAYDAFVAKVNAAGDDLLYCGYVGGIRNERGNSIAVDAGGSAYVTGQTESDELSFPVRIGPSLTSGGGIDAFVFKVNPTGILLDYCGYIGGAYDDIGHGIKVDGQGSAFVTGTTGSTAVTFPVLAGPDLSYNGGTSDAFVVSVNAQGTGFDYCGYIGGDKADEGIGLALDGEGAVYVTGWTSSSESTFPNLIGPDFSRNGVVDAFLAKVESGGAGLAHCGYIGGESWTVGFDVATDGFGNAYVTGWTDSTESSFPVTLGPELLHHGDKDAFVTKVSYGDVVPDLKFNGNDNPIMLPYGHKVDLTLTLASGSQTGVVHDWWIVSDKFSGPTYSYVWPGKLRFGVHPSFTAPLAPISGYLLYNGRFPRGTWTLTFIVDYADGDFQGTYKDSVIVTVY